jgi:ubiquinone/menaquinone biosynthesis C-methylase UbiE
VSRAEALARRIRPWLTGTRVLDLGGGRGKVSAALRELRMQPTVSDVLDRSEFKPYIHQDDPFAVPVDSGSFDSVMLLYVLHHVPRPDQAKLLTEAKRIARSRLVIVEDVPRRWERPITKLWDFVFNRPFGIPTPFSFRTVEEWVAELGSVEHVDVFRPLWPGLGMLRHAMFVLETHAPEPPGIG